MPRAGHLLNLEEPELFNALVFRFLAAVECGRWSEWKAAPPSWTVTRRQANGRDEKGRRFTAALSCTNTSVLSD
jgi:hypothetical protein